jgi:hypothetical protein
MTVLLRWSGDGLAGNLTTGSAGSGDTAPSFITGATPTIEPSGARPPAIRFAQAGTTVNYAVWTFSASDLYAYTIRGYVNFSGFPASDQAAVWKFVNAGETLASWAFAITSGGFARIMDKNGSTAATGDVALVAGLWYRIEAVTNGDVTNLYVYEGESTTAHDTVSATLAAPVAGGRVRVGNDFGTPNLPPFWFDDLAISNEATLIGPVDDATLYITLTDIKGQLDVDDAIDDVRLARAVRTACRSIDKVCGRVFYAEDTATARTFEAATVTRVKVDDFYTTSGLIVGTDADDDGVYETTWAASDYQLRPLNGVVDGEPGWPYYVIRAVSLNRFPCGRRASIQVTAKWGWAAVPDSVVEAAFVLAEDIYKLRDTPFGVGGFGDFGRIRAKQNPHVMMLISPYIKDPVLLA